MRETKQGLLTDVTGDDWRELYNRGLICRCGRMVYKCECGQNYICLDCGIGVGTMPCNCDGVIAPVKPKRDFPELLK